MNTKYALCLAFLISIAPAAALAQLYECDGQWTNKPCSGAPTRELSELPARVQSEEDRELSKRKLWLHELEMLSVDAKRRYNIATLTGPIRDLCLNEKSSSDDCRNAIDKKEQELQTLMAQYARSESQQSSATSQSSAQAPAVTIINQPPVVYVRPRRRHVHTYSTGGTSVTVNGSGTVGDASVSVGVTAGSSYGSSFQQSAPLTPGIVTPGIKNATPAELPRAGGVAPRLLESAPHTED